MRWLLFIILFVGSFSMISAQTTDRFNLQDFMLSGNAFQTGDRCFQLTPAANWAFGAIWNKKAISLLDPFEMELELFFGCNDLQGADGIVFVFHPYADRRGARGEGMGFRGLSPSLGFELDTYWNPHLDDPQYDHLALMVNGQTNHRFGGTRPIPVSSSSDNIEDCKNHKLKVNWDPRLKRLQVFFDGVKRLEYKEDIVKNIFQNHSAVYWGFTAATGAKNNRQAVCLEKLVYSEVSVFDIKVSRKILQGENYVLENVEFISGASSLLPGSFTELDRLYNLLRSNPRAVVTITGHTDSQGAESTNQRLSQARAESVRDYLIRKGIDGKRLKSVGYGEKFPIANNNTSSGRRQNRRVTVYLTIPQV